MIRNKKMKSKSVFHNTKNSTFVFNNEIISFLFIETKQAILAF